MSESGLLYADRLRSFISSFRSVRSHKNENLLATALERYLERARTFLHAEDGSQPEPTPIRLLAPERLQNLIELLLPQLRGAERRGHFIDLWSIAGLGRAEVRNTPVLAWLLNPRGSHGLGSSLLEALFLRVRRQQPCWVIDDNELARVTVRTEHQPLDDVRDRVDIALDGPSFIAFIEVKIDASEGPNQLGRYVEAAERKRRAYGKSTSHVIYLSPRPSKSHLSSVAEISCSDLSHALRQVRSKAPSDNVTRMLLRSYEKHIADFN